MAVENDQILQYFDVEYGGIREDDFPEQVQTALEVINRKIAAHESLDAVMNFLFDATTAICPCDRIGLAFVEEDGGRVIAHWARATYSPLLLGPGYAEDMNKSSLREVIQHSKVRLIHDLTRYLRANPDSESTKLLINEGVRSSMTCPLYVEGRPVALLFRSSLRPKAFDEYHVRQHLATAERLSQAVEKTYKIQHVEQLNRSYMEMLGFVSHELKGPLASMIMDGRLLIDEYLGALDEKQKRKITGIVSRAEYLLGLVREYLDLARIEGGELKPRILSSVDFIADVVDPALEIVQAQIDAKQMKLIWPRPGEPLLVELDPELIRIVMVNLLSNAVKYGFQNGEIRMVTRFEEGELRVSVRNEGFGFPKRQKSMLFRKFSRLDSPRSTKAKGTGVGLFTCWRIIRLHGGTINGESQHGQWAEFSFMMPQPLKLHCANKHD